MFGNLLGDMEEKKKAMNDRLDKIEIEAEAGEGAVRVKVNANQKVLNIKFDKEKMDWEDTEQVEDLLMVAMNRALEEASQRASEEGQNMMKEMLPPGMGDLGNLFG